MLDTFKYEKGYWYPHMKPNDIAIWEKFIDQNPNAYNSVQYDFNVGDAPPFDTLSQFGEDLNQDALYRLKIDVVGHIGSKIDIIELKHDAKASTIGQVQAYKKLYDRDWGKGAPTNMVIITDKLNPNMEYLCKVAGVKLVVI